MLMVFTLRIINFDFLILSDGQAGNIFGDGMVFYNELKKPVRVGQTGI